MKPAQNPTRTDIYAGGFRSHADGEILAKLIMSGRRPPSPTISGDLDDSSEPNEPFVIVRNEKRPVEDDWVEIDHRSNLTVYSKPATVPMSTFDRLFTLAWKCGDRDFFMEAKCYSDRTPLLRPTSDSDILDYFESATIAKFLAMTAFLRDCFAEPQEIDDFHDGASFLRDQGINWYSLYLMVVPELHLKAKSLEDGPTHMRSFAHASGVVSTMTMLLVFLKLEQHHDDSHWATAFMDMVTTVNKELEAMELLIATDYVDVSPTVPLKITKHMNMDDTFD